MRRIILFVVVLFMTVPALAVPDVNIVCEAVGDEVTVSYVITNNPEGHLIRAFGLDITVDTANITDVCVVDANYRIYPGQIVIVDGEVTDYNTPYAPDDLGDANVTIEMGSLYTWDTNYIGDANAGYGMEPGTSGTLLKFYVDGSCHYTITENPVVGGIVMEDPEEVPTVSLCEGDVEFEVCDCPGDVSGSISGTLPVDGYIKAADAITVSGWVQLYGVKGKITCPWTPPGWIPTGCDDCPGDVSGSISGTLPPDGYIKAADAITISGWVQLYGVKGKITCPWTPPGW